MIKGDFHIHSIASDGVLHPCDIVKYATKKGFKVIAITDHNTFLGSIMARKCGINDIVIIYGAEVRSEIGDILLLCDSYFLNISRTIRNLIDIKSHYNCLLIPAHPLSIVRNLLLAEQRLEQD